MDRFLLRTAAGFLHAYYNICIHALNKFQCFAIHYAHLAEYAEMKHSENIAFHCIDDCCYVIDIICADEVCPLCRSSASYIALIK